MPSDLETRIERLEIDLTHANQTIDDLSSVVIAQGRQIEHLTRSLSQMNEQVEDLIETVHPGHPVDKPPHY